MMSNLVICYRCYEIKAVKTQKQTQKILKEECCNLELHQTQNYGNVEDDQSMLKQYLILYL